MTDWTTCAAAHPDRFLWIDGRPVPVIAGGKGGGKTTTTVVNQIPPKTPEEVELIRKQNSILDIQISELRRQNEALTAIFPQQQKLLSAQTEAAIAGAEAQRIQISQITELSREQLPLIKEQTGLAREQVGIAREQLGIQRKAGDLQEKLITKALAELEGTPEEREIRTLSNQRALAILKGEAPPLLPGQQERINRIFDAAREEATAELTRFGEDIATTRGLRVSDSPIGNELVRQKRTLEQNLAAGKAGAELNVGQAEQVFSESVRQFQENLRQQAFQNRLALTGRASPFFMPPLVSLPIGGGMSPIFAGSTTSGALAGAGNLLQILGAERLGQPTQTSVGRVFGAGGGFNVGGALTGGISGAGAGALGGAAIGAAAGPIGPFAGALIGGTLGLLGGGFGGSSATLKKDILPLDRDEYDKALDKVRAVPLVRYRYRWEGDARAPHIGPILEMSPEEIREDALRINLLDYTGLVHAGLKGLDRKVERFGEALAAAMKEAA